MNRYTNLVRVKAVHTALSHLSRDVVFVGGATVELYVDRGAPEIRPTDDVDVLIELWAYKDFAAIEEQLRKIGFINDADSKVISRYKLPISGQYDIEDSTLTVDIMATGKDVLGFTNSWYAEGYKHSIDCKLDHETTIRIFSAPYFIASKLEAFQSPSRQDNNNGFQSRDFEDIIFVLEHRLAIWEELKVATGSVQRFLKLTFGKLMQNPRFEEWVEAHAGWGSPPATYYIIDELEKFVATRGEEI
jgi:predicted nucleotidyltransferase